MIYDLKSIITKMAESVTVPWAQLHMYSCGQHAFDIRILTGKFGYVAISNHLVRRNKIDRKQTK